MKELNGAQEETAVLVPKASLHVSADRTGPVTASARPPMPLRSPNPGGDSFLFTSSGPRTTLSGRMIPGALEKSLGIYVALGWASTVTGDVSVWRPR